MFSNAVILQMIVFCLTDLELIYDTLPRLPPSTKEG